MAYSAINLFHFFRANLLCLAFHGLWTSTIVDAQAAKSFRLNPLTNFCSRWCEWHCSLKTYPYALWLEF
jgi:hypothetical protein